MSSIKTKSTYMTGHAPLATQHHEWRTAENSATHLLPTLKEKVSQNPHISLLDIGAGSGTITASLAKYMPSGTITAFDQSKEILEKASRHADSVGVSNITFTPGDAYALPFADESFDVVHASMILAHLSDPVLAIREMLRVTRRDGGVVSLREPDLRAWSYFPADEGIRAFNELLCRAQFENVGHPDAGQRLVGWVMEAGVGRGRIRAGAGAWCFSSEEEKKVWGGTMVDRCENGMMREKALKEGWATEEDFQRMKGGWQRWIESEQAWFGCLNGELLAFR